MFLWSKKGFGHLSFLHNIGLVSGCNCFFGLFGFRGTKELHDFTLAGRSVHPYMMAIPYGASFISTSAIVGFGGVAGVYGLGILWLPFLNIFLGTIIAFLVFGKKTREMGEKLNAQTFPEFLGKRYQSPLIQRISGMVIFFFMPLAKQNQACFR